MDNDIHAIYDALARFIPNDLFERKEKKIHIPFFLSTFYEKYCRLSNFISISRPSPAPSLVVVQQSDIYKKNCCLAAKAREMLHKKIQCVSYKRGEDAVALGTMYF